MAVPSCRDQLCHCIAGRTQKDIEGERASRRAAGKEYLRWEGRGLQQFVLTIHKGGWKVEYDKIVWGS